MKEHNQIGIIFPSKDRPETVKRLVKSLASTNHSAYVYCMLDKTGPIQEYRDIFSKYFWPNFVPETDGSLYTIVTHSLEGIHKPYNEGIRLAIQDGCDTFLVIDDDTVFQEPSPELKYNIADQAYKDLLPTARQSALDNFDIINWQQSVLDLLNDDSPARCIFFSKPDRPGAFAFGKRILDDLKDMGRNLFDENYPSGYYSDNDYFLELYGLSSLTPKNLCKEHIAVVRNWITHLHTNEGSSWPSSNLNTENLKYFRSKWKEVHPLHPAARELKNNGKFFALANEV